MTRRSPLMEAVVTIILALAGTIFLLSIGRIFIVTSTVRITTIISFLVGALIVMSAVGILCCFFDKKCQ